MPLDSKGHYTPPGGGNFHPSQPQQSWQPQPQNGSSYTPSAPPQQQLATKTDQFGKPYFGEGLQGVSRRIFSYMFGTQNYNGTASTPAGQQMVQQQLDSTGKALKAINWDAWGRQLFGISSQDIQTSQGAMRNEIVSSQEQLTGGKPDTSTPLQTAEANTATLTSGLNRAKNEWIDLGMKALGGIDNVWKAGVAVSQAVGSFAEPQKTSSVAPGQQIADPIKAAFDLVPGFAEARILADKVGGNSETDQGFFQTLARWPAHYVDLSVNEVKGVVGIVKGLTSGSLTPADVGNRIAEFVKGSEAAYTMMDSAVAMQDYQNRFARGEPAGFISQDIQHPMSELIGSLTDPAMYLGSDVVVPFIGKTQLALPFLGDVSIGGKAVMLPWKVVGTIPSFGEIFGFGRTVNLINEGNRFTAAVPEIANAAKSLENPSQIDAAQRLVDASRQMASGVRSFYKDYSLGALTADGKANILARDAKAILQGVVASTKDTERTLQLLNDSVMVVRGTPEEAAAAVARIASDPAGKFMLSQAGMQTAELTARMSETGLLEKIVSKSKGDPAVLSSEIMRTLNGVAHDMVPSVEEMATATADAKKAGVLPGVLKLAKQVNSGDITQAEHDLQLAAIAKDAKLKSNVASLAQKFNDLPWYVKGMNTTTKAYEKTIYNAIAGAMGKVYIGWNVAFPARKVLGQSLAILADMGAGESARITAEALSSTAPILGPKWTEAYIARNAAESKSLLGVEAETITRGFKGSGFSTPRGGELPGANNAELVTSGDIYLSEVKKNLDNFIAHGGNPDATAFGVSPDLKNYWDKRILETHGNSALVINEMRQKLGQGFVEAQTMVHLPPDLQDLLHKVHQDGAVQSIIASSKSQAEATQRLSAFFKSIEDAGYKGASLEPASLSGDVPKAMVESFYDAGKAVADKVLQPGEDDNFARMVQSFQNMRTELNAGAVRVNDLLASDLSNAGLTQQLQQFQDMRVGTYNAEAAAYPAMNKVRNAVMGEAGLYDRSKAGEDIAKLWGESVVDTGTKYGAWSLKDIYPKVDPRALSRQDFNHLLIRSFLDFNATNWRDVNVSFYDGMYNAMKFASDSLGQPLENIVSQGNAQSSNFFERAAQMRAQAEAIHSELFAGMAARVALRNVPLGTTLADAPAALVGDKNALFEAINAARAAKKEAPLGSLSDVPRQEWAAMVKDKGFFGQLGGKTQDFQSFNAWAVKKGATVDEAIKAFQDPTSELAKQFVAETGGAVGAVPSALEGPPPHSGIYTHARAVYQNTTDPGYVRDRNLYIQSVSNAWGTKIPVGSLGGSTDANLSALKTEFDSRLGAVKPKISAMATAARDFIMNDYNKTYLERGIAYGAPFSYFHIEAAQKWLQRVADNPRLIIDYMAYRKYLEQVHAGLPNTYKYNMGIDSLPGIDLANPLVVNIENVINPVRSLTNTPFSDPIRRADWLSTTVDNLNQMSGSSLMTPVMWAVGLHLYQQGQQDAASRWMGQLFPQSSGIKAGLTLAQNVVGAKPINAGPFIQNNQVDPFVNFLDNGQTPYERTQTVAALTQMVNDGKITQEQALDAAHNQSSPLWQQASQDATSADAPYKTASFFTGFSVKPANPSDQTNYDMSTDIGKLMSMKDNMSPSDYQNAWTQLGNKYPNMDVLLLSRKGGSERDTSYAYNVLSRLPPGGQTQIFNKMGITPAEVNTFYQSKGFATTTDAQTGAAIPWTPEQKDRFMNAVAYMGAALKIPSSSTQAEWTQARNVYKQLDAFIAQQYGPDIANKISTYYNIKADDPAAADTFAQNNPDIFKALSMKQAAIVNTPILSAYYGGIDTIEHYVNAQVSNQLTSRYGADIYQKQQIYYDKQQQDVLNGAGHSKVYLKLHPELVAFWKDNRTLQVKADQMYVDLGSKLPQGVPGQVRPEFQAAPFIGPDLVNAINQPTGLQPKTWNDIRTTMPPALAQMVANNILRGTKLQPKAVTELDYVAQRSGFGTSRELLRQAAVALQLLQNAQP